jgi:uncharacterized protein
MNKIEPSWAEYHQKIEQLAVQIYQSNWHFDQIVCIAKGGLRVGDILARIYDRPLGILSTASYGGVEGQHRGALKIARHLTAIGDTLGPRVLLVDDLVDTGISLKETKHWLNCHYANQIQEIRTAVLWYKDCSEIQPDYSVDYLTDNPWIHQPFEGYEQITPQMLESKHSK